MVQSTLIISTLLISNNRLSREVKIWSLFLHGTLLKHAYSNILKISEPKKENFQMKNSDFFHISAQNIMYTPVNPSFTI